MSSRNRLILIIGSSILALVLLLSLGIWWFMKQTPSTSPTTTTTPTNTTNTTNRSQSSTNSTNTGNTTTPVVITPESERETIIRLAKSFTERYGSFSTDNNGSNVEALYSFMTDQFQQTANQQVNKGNNTAGFYSMSTQATTTTIVDYVEGGSTATVEVTTRRTETVGLDQPATTTQTARLDVKKVGDTWKVDKLRWL